MNLIIEPGAGNRRVISDNGTPNDGISEAVNASNGTFTDFKNPSGTLTVVDTSATGGSTYVYQGLDAVGRPANIVLNTNGKPDFLNFTGTASTAVFNIPASTYTIDNQLITIQGFTGHLVSALNTVNTTVDLANGTSNIFAINPGIGFTCVQNTAGPLTLDFYNPSDSLVFKATGPNTTASFFGLDPIGDLPSIIVIRTASITLTALKINQLATCWSQNPAGSYSSQAYNDSTDKPLDSPRTVTWRESQLIVGAMVQSLDGIENRPPPSPEVWRDRAEWRCTAHGQGLPLPLPLPDQFPERPP